MVETAGPIEYLELLYPVLKGDPCGSISVLDVELALNVARGRRPACLNETDQDLAQAHYAAYLLSIRLQHLRSIALGPLTEEREGEVWIKYGKYAEAGGAMTPYESWKQMNARCRRGAITVNPRCEAYFFAGY